MLDYTGLNIQTNIGPYGREEGYLGESVPGRNIAAAPPGSGAFEIGAVIESSATVNRRGDALEGGERADDRSRDSRGSDGGGILDLLRGLFGGGERSGGSGSGGSDDTGGANGSQTGSRSGSGEVLGWEYTEEGWVEIRG